MGGKSGARGLPQPFGGNRSQFPGALGRAINPQQSQSFNPFNTPQQQFTPQTAGGLQVSPQSSFAPQAPPTATAQQKIQELGIQPQGLQNNPGGAGPAPFQPPQFTKTVPDGLQVQPQGIPVGNDFVSKQVPQKNILGGPLIRFKR